MIHALAPLGAAILTTLATAQQGFTLIEIPVGANPHQVAVADLDLAGWKDFLIHTTAPTGLFHARVHGHGVPPLGHLMRGPGGGSGPTPPPKKPPTTYEIECNGSRTMVGLGEDGNLMYFYETPMTVQGPSGPGVYYDWVASGSQPWHVVDQNGQPISIGPNDDWSLVDIDDDGDIDRLIIIRENGDVLVCGNNCGKFTEGLFPSGNIIHGIMKIIVGGGDDDDHGTSSNKKKKLVSFEDGPAQYGFLTTDISASGAVVVTSTTSLPFPVGAGVHKPSIAVLASRTTAQLAAVDLQQPGGPSVSYFAIPFIATSVATADLNSDGILDAIVANESSGNLGVQYGVEPGFPGMGFANLGSAPGPRSILATDLDQDGDIDLVTSNGGNQSATIWIQGPIPTVPGVTAYGAGTPGCTGYEAMDLSAPPKIGTTFSVLGARAPLSSVGLLLFGTAPDVQGSDLFGIGAVLHIDLVNSFELHSFTVTSDGLGNTQLPIALPNVPGIVGASFYGQLIWHWTNPNCGILPTTLSAFGLSTSHGLQLTIQP